MRLTRLVYPNYDKSAAAQFVAKYPGVKALIKQAKGRNIVGRYNAFIRLMDKGNEPTIGGKPETLTAPSFGTKTFYHYEWPTDKYGSQIGFAEVFTYCVEELHI